METNIPVAKKPFYKRKWVWAVTIIVLIIIGSGDSTPKPQAVNTNGTSEISESETKEEKRTTYKVGESVQLGKSVITVNEVTFSKAGQYNKPSEGNEWIDLNITIENKDSSQQYVTTLGQMFIRDAEGNSYQVAVTGKSMENMSNRLDGAIIANSKRTGWVGFEIPKDSTGLQFQFNGGLWTGGEVIIDIVR